VACPLLSRLPGQPASWRSSPVSASWPAAFPLGAWLAPQVKLLDLRRGRRHRHGWPLARPALPAPGLAHGEVRAVVQRAAAVITNIDLHGRHSLRRSSSPPGAWAARRRRATRGLGGHNPAPADAHAPAAPSSEKRAPGPSERAGKVQHARLRQPEQKRGAHRPRGGNPGGMFPD